MEKNIFEKAKDLPSPGNVVRGRSRAFRRGIIEVYVNKNGIRGVALSTAWKGLPETMLLGTQ